MSARLPQPLLAYLALAICVIMVEVAYGVFAGSLGLVCDGMHMLINCGGIATSVVALKGSQKPPTLESSFGFARMHVLAAFTNAIFLVFASTFIAVEALHRFTGFAHGDVGHKADAEIDRPHLHNSHEDHVISVASVACVVNFVGLLLLALGARNSQSIQKERFSPRRATESHSRIEESLFRHAELLNLQSVVVHAVCDVVNSFGVIVSAILVRSKGWDSADPLVALIIAVLILRASMPLLFTSGTILLQETSARSRSALDQALREISVLPGVLESHREKQWSFVPGISVTTLNVRVRSEVNEQDMLLRIHDILTKFSHHVTIQIDKDHLR